MSEPVTRTPHWQDYASAWTNGILGDWLAARENPLAITMQFRYQGVRLEPETPAVDQPRGTLVLLIHGLTALESIWHYPDRPGASYGTDLGEALYATPLSLRYNSGLPIPCNGEALAHELERLLARWPRKVENLILIGHSMGGLLIRSACFHGRRLDHQWTRTVSTCVYIGSPHDGSWFARGAHALADIMSRMPRDYIRVAGEFIDLRSEGIRNLSRGEVAGSDVDEPPLLPGVKHYVISGLLARRQQHPVNALFGDALVHESSARGAQRPGWMLSGVANFPGIHHIRLAHDQGVSQQLMEWLV